MPPVFQVDLVKGFSDKTMHVNFVSEGGMTVFFGKSGAGKSVTLRCIAGLLKPDSGKIVIKDKPYFDSQKNINLPPQSRKVGYVFQSYALFPHLTVTENISIAMNGLTKKGSHKRVEQLLNEVDITALASRRPADLSGGEQQRVALARALAREPDVLLLDEPFSAVDAPNRDRLRALLKKVQRQRNIPAILVTHQAFEAFGMADCIVVMDNGKVEQVGTPQEVFNHPKTIKTARLVGAKNIFTGKVHEIKDGKICIEHDGNVWEAIRPQNFEITQNADIHWCIRPDAIMVLREDRPGFNSRENRLRGTVAEIEKKGPVWDIYFISDSALPLKIEIPAHAANHMKLAVGKKISVSLKKEAINIITTRLSSRF